MQSLILYKEGSFHQIFFEPLIQFLGIGMLPALNGKNPSPQ
jgi:hypothetical protein